MITTLTGSNDFMRNAELRAMTQKVVAEFGDMAVERLDGASASSDAMLGALQSPPFLTAHKLVILREPGQQKAFAEGLEQAAKAIPEQTDVILVEPKLDKRLGYYKFLKKHTTMLECAELDGAALTRWATAFVKERGGTLEPAASRELLNRCGSQQQIMHTELQKLLAFSPDITLSTVQLLTPHLPQSTVFTLLDAAFAGKTKQALALYDEQRSLKVEPLAILAMMAWQLHILALVKTAGSRTADAIAKEAKVSPFVVRKTQGLARSMSLAHLKKRIAMLLEIDLRLKRESLDADEAMRLYLLSLAS